jgi:hypothetical protein
MFPTEPTQATRPAFLIAGVTTLALAFIACTGASPSSSVGSTGVEPSVSAALASRAPVASPTPVASSAALASSAPVVSPTPVASHSASTRCANTPDASPSATVAWTQELQGTATIKAGQAVKFVTSADADSPTVTEGTLGTAVADPCIDASFGVAVPLMVTFYKPGDYKLFCRRLNSMHTVIHVTK